MLKNVLITSFRTCKKTKFRIDSNISALIGQNGAGKTNILQAIATIGTLVRGVKAKEDIDITISFLLNKINYQYKLQRTFLKGSDIVTDSLINDSKEVIFEKEKTKVAFAKKVYDALPETPALYLLSNLTNDRVIKNVYNYLTSNRYYHMHEYYEGEEIMSPFVNALFVKKDFDEWKSKPEKESISTIAFKFFDLYKNQNEIFQEIEKIVIDLNIIEKMSFRHIKTPKLEDKEENEYLLLVFVIQGKTRYFSQLSEGTKRILLMLLNLFYDNAKLMLIEEPESSIHFGLMKKLIDLFRAYSDEHQIIFSTHSSQVMDKLKPNELIFIHMEQDITIAKNPTAKKIKEINYFLNETGPLGDYIIATGGEG
jgi:predicted ATPase